MIVVHFSGIASKINHDHETRALHGAGWLHWWNW